jgi:hypothetical protein
MPAPVKCAKGHWYQPDPSGKPTPCPRCLAAQQRREHNAISDDDVMAFLNDPKPANGSSPDEDASASQKLHKPAALKRHKKVCRDCHSETSFAFNHCPRCGGPLEIAVIEVP